MSPDVKILQGSLISGINFDNTPTAAGELVHKPNKYVRVSDHELILCGLSEEAAQELTERVGGEIVESGDSK